MPDTFLSAATRLWPRLRAALLALPVALLAALPALGFETRARAIHIVDHNTGTVLFSANADVPLPPASMSKLMTLNMLFEAIEDGRIQPDTTFSVSTRARQMPGSRMFVEERHRPTAEDLIRGIAVLSGNDATVVVAEGLAGSEEAFARLMTERARAMGLSQTTLANASGLPHPDHRMSMRDLVSLAQHLIDRHGRFYHYLSEDSFTWNEITQRNRVPLLDAGLGFDGLKTGFTSEAGYSLTGSARQGNRRVVFAFAGLSSEAERAEEAERIINWAFRQFVERKVLAPDSRVAEAEVWMGSATRVGLVPGHEVRLVLPAIVQNEVAAEVVYRGPVEAPVTRGQHLADLIVTVPGMEPHRIALLAEADVAHGGFLARMRTAADVALRKARQATLGS